MYTAIIADDEKKICQLIMKLGNWEALGIEIVDICADGEEVLNSIRKNQPNIVLTDIRMPVYDGLEIIQKIHEMKMNISVIIISGYKHFEYAQKALQYGVVDFLVKPIDKNQLHVALQSAVKKIVQSRETGQQDAEIELLKREKSKLLREGLFSDVLRNKSIDTLQGEYQNEFASAGGIFQALLIRTNREDLNVKNSLFSEKTNEIVLQETAICNEILAASTEEGLFVMLNYDEEHKSQIRSQLMKIYKRSILLEETFGLFSLSIGVGVPIVEIGNLIESVSTARTAWKARILCTRKAVLEYEFLNFAVQGAETLCSEEEYEQFVTGIETNQKERVTFLINTLEMRVQRSGLLSPEVLFEIVEKLSYRFVFAIYHNQLDKQKEFMNQVNKELLQADNSMEFFIILKHCFITTMQKHYNNKLEVESGPINDAKKIMEEKYHTPLSLEEVASLVGLSPVYFSRLFKKVEGCNYIDYLTGVRIGAAKEKLRKTNLSIEEIVYAVGYTDEKYFRKLFKKQTGIRPTEYRRLHQ